MLRTRDSRLLPRPPQDPRPPPRIPPKIYPRPPSQDSPETPPKNLLPGTPPKTHPRPSQDSLPGPPRLPQDPDKIIPKTPPRTTHKTPQDLFKTLPKSLAQKPAKNEPKFLKKKKITPKTSPRPPQDPLKMKGFRVGARGGKIGE